MKKKKKIPAAPCFTSRKWLRIESKHDMHKKQQKKSNIKLFSVMFQERPFVDMVFGAELFVFFNPRI